MIRMDVSYASAMFNLMKKLPGSTGSRGPRRWRPLGALTDRGLFDKLYEVHKDGSIHCRGKRATDRRARKDAMQARSSKPGRLVESGAPLRRSGRTPTSWVELERKTRRAAK